jgi:hypothetical protein
VSWSRLSTKGILHSAYSFMLISSSKKCRRKQVSSSISVLKSFQIMWRSSMSSLWTPICRSVEINQRILWPSFSRSWTNASWTTLFYPRTYSR